MAVVEMDDQKWTRVINLLSSKCLHCECFDLISIIANQVQRQQNLDRSMPLPSANKQGNNHDVPS